MRSAIEKVWASGENIETEQRHFPARDQTPRKRKPGATNPSSKGYVISLTTFATANRLTTGSILYRVILDVAERFFLFAENGYCYHFCDITSCRCDP